MIQTHESDKENVWGTSKAIKRVPGPKTKEQSDPQTLDYLAEEIFNHLHGVQWCLQPPMGYMDFQADINENMRAVLVEWLIEVHYKFKLLPETLYLGINILDRYLASQRVSRGDLQLVGASALFIACKYEEIYPPDVGDLVYITDYTYTKQQILGMEFRILRELDFALTVVSEFRLLERYSKLMGYEESQFFTAQFFLENFMISYESLKFSVSVRAAAAVYITNKIFAALCTWPQELVDSSGLLEQDLHACIVAICVQLQKNEGGAVHRKFSNSRYGSVSTSRRLQILK